MAEWMPPHRSASLSSRGTRSQQDHGGMEMSELPVLNAAPPTPRQPSHRPADLQIRLPSYERAQGGPKDSDAFDQYDDDDQYDLSKAGPYSFDQDRDGSRISVDREDGTSAIHLVTAASPSAGLFPPDPPNPPVKPTLGLLFSLSSRKEICLLVLSAMLVSAAGSVIQPYLTTIMGEAFDVFADYVRVTSETSSPTAIEPAKDRLMSGILIVFIKLIAMAVATVLTSAVSLIFWNQYSETVVRRLRAKFYNGVTSRSLDWFDLGMGLGRSDPNAQDGGAEGQEDSSSGGIAGRFARDTDDVRMATGQTLGLGFQAFMTAILCIILAMYRSYQLTLIILVTFPLVIIASAIVERFTAPLLHVANDLIASGAGRIERSVGAIATVKAFNAEKLETDAFLDLARHMRSNYNKITMAWGFRLGVSQFFLFSSFISGFWFGNRLVNEGKLTPGQVTEVFWATLIASSSLQAVLPFLGTIETGKIGMAGLLNLLNEPAATATGASPPSPELEKAPVSPITPNTITSPTSATFAKAQKRSKNSGVRQLRKIRPDSFSGELAVRNVIFHYPTRPHPHPPTLNNISMFLPARETTFIVGQSGSGKSTIGSLLMGLYKPDSGSIEAAEQGIEWLDQSWLRGQIAMVSQGASVLFDGTIHDNVAIGTIAGSDNVDRARRLDLVSRDRVVEACRVALVHDFIRDLPDGYDTILSGEKGASLSGGQRQRLAIARAIIRNPTVLILDEATSALDATSRLLVYEAVKRRRVNMTTIVITHDLSPIVSTDFVYVLKDGRVVEQGFRSELDDIKNGWFAQMAALQAMKSKDERAAEMDETVALPRQSVGHSARMSLAPGAANSVAFSMRNLWNMHRMSSYQESMLEPTHDIQKQNQFLETLFAQPHSQTIGSAADSRRMSGMSIIALEEAARSANTKRGAVTRRGRKMQDMTEKDAAAPDVAVTIDAMELPPQISFWGLYRRLLPIIPNKVLLFVGFGFCVLAGVTTPVFSIFISSMLATVGTDADSKVLVRTCLLALLIAAIDGVAMWLKYSLLQRAAMGWVTHIRETSIYKMLSQDKSWFDRPENTAMKLSNITVKDIDDARNMIGMIAGQFVIVIVMLLLGLSWALAVGWELTLVGMAVAPIMILVLGWQTKVLGAYEQRNKMFRDDITNKFYQAVVNVRAIRSMSIESVFTAKYEDALELSHQSHKKAAYFTGTAFSVGQAMNILVEGVMFYVGAVMIKNDRYTFQQMLQVFALIVFSVTFAAQTMSYVPAIMRCVSAANDLLRIYDLSQETAESEGRMTYPITGNLSFDHVNFAYPSRPDAPALKNMTFKISAGECVGIVGASGSGKSTITSLIQRLYEPQSGEVSLDGRVLGRTDVHFLRSHIAFVSQHPALFDMSVSDNIAYGTDATQKEIEYAARLASAHDFIMQLPHQYKTNLGENASLLSGGQAQRLQIARAIVKQREVLILDECTSALDPENQAIVMETIANVKSGRTTLIVTHKLDLMRMCDRLLVVDQGRIVESGSFAQLVAAKGVFATLAAAGEWNM